MRIYLAGPEVFHKDAPRLGARKIEICRRHGFEGLYPIDPDAADLAGAKAEQARLIFSNNLALMRRADICVANITPYKGLDCDQGTAWEIAFFYASQKRAYAYSNTRALIRDRDQRLATVRAPDETTAYFPFGSTSPEDFDLTTNLMIRESIYGSGGFIIDAEARDFTDLEAFEELIDAIAAKAR